MKDFKKELKELPSDYIVLLIVAKEKYNEYLPKIFKEISLKKSGAYVTINKPYKTLNEILKKNNIKTDNLNFIDCITSKGEKTDNVVFLKSPSALTSIGVSLDSIFKSKEKSFIFIDSLDSLLVYNSKEVVIKFTRALMERARENKICGIMLALKENTIDVVTGDLSLICDKIIILE